MTKERYNCPPNFSNEHVYYATHAKKTDREIIVIMTDKKCKNRKTKATSLHDQIK